MSYAVGGVVEGEEAGAVVVRVDDAGATVADELEVAPIRCCNSSAILIVVRSIADFGR